jgi:hypothetical protein
MEPTQLALMRSKFESLCHELGYDVSRDEDNHEMYRRNSIKDLWRFFLCGGSATLKMLDELKGAKL